MKEEYRWIKNFEGLYKVSNFGNVKSFYGRKKIGYILKFDKNRGYLFVQLRKNKIKVRKRVHRLVLETFHTNKDRKPFINHKNGNKLDNRVKNLEWCTQKENMVHASKNNLLCKGEECKKSKLKKYQVLEIRKKYIPFLYSYRKLGKEYGVSKGAIKEIIKLRNWKHI